MKKVSLGTDSGCTYAEVVGRFQFLQNPQKIFDGQNDMCKGFQCIESNERQTISYKVTNDCIAIQIDYEKDSDWDVLRGKNFYNGCFTSTGFIYSAVIRVSLLLFHSTDFGRRKKKTVEYKFPLSLEKFDLRIFHYDVFYLNYDAINFNNFHKLLQLKKWLEKMIEFLKCVFVLQEMNLTKTSGYSLL